MQLNIFLNDTLLFYFGKKKTLSFLFQTMPAESLTLEQQLAQYPLFNQLTAQAQAQLLSDLQKQQQSLSQGIQLITLPTLPSPGTASASSPSPDSQSTANISVNSVREHKVAAEV